LSIGLKGNNDGSGAVQIGGSDAISISTGLNTTFAGTITASGGVMYPLTSGTAVSATGTAIDLTGIPSWVRRVTVMFNGVSTNGTSNIQVQLGTTSGVETSSYAGSTFVAQTTGVGTSSFSTGFLIDSTTSATDVRSGAIILSTLGSNVWVGIGNFALTNISRNSFLSGAKTTATTLDRVRITTVNGTDTFDAGTINLLWE